MPDHSLYDTDIVAWAEQQVAGLRRLALAPPSNAVDWDNVIEEVESLGRAEVSGVERHLVFILAHLLKWLSTPEVQATQGWRAEIVTFQGIAADRFTPSMRQKLDMDAIWRDARKDAEAGLAYFGDPLIGGLPSSNPLALDDLIAQDFDLDKTLVQLASALRRGAR